MGAAAGCVQQIRELTGTRRLLTCNVDATQHVKVQMILKGSWRLPSLTLCLICSCALNQTLLKIPSGRLRLDFLKVRSFSEQQV